MHRIDKFYREISKDFEKVARGKKDFVESIEFINDIKRFQFTSKSGLSTAIIKNYDPITNRILIKIIENNQEKELSLFRFWSHYMPMMSLVET